MHALMLSVLMSFAADDWQVLSDLPAESAPPKMLATWLNGQAKLAFDRRQETYDKLKSADEIRAYQERLRTAMVEALGGFPERTPLNAQVVGKLPGDGYSIEKVLFESRPRHHVTGLLFLPDGKGPFPAVIIPSGHSATAKSADYNQKVGISLARIGIAGFAYDPIGQGERRQLLTPEGKPKYSGTTTEHFLVGVNSLLLGQNTATFRIWDGMRAIDYLASRSDIDATKIGATGCSGGGTLTSYLMALDDRVTCAAPACYITTFRRLLETIGPQDSEQNIFGQVATGLEHPDYLILRAPKPTLICSTTRDFFDISGSWDAYRQAKRIYSRLGFPERVDLVESDGTHGVTPVGRATIVQWMRRWLLSIDGPITESEFTIATNDQARCTPDGQVLRLPGEKSVFDFNRELAERLVISRSDRKETLSPEQVRKSIRETAGVRPIAMLPDFAVRNVGSIKRDGYRVDKLVFQPEPGVSLPALLFVPAKPAGPATLYLHSEGKQADTAALEKLAAEGQLVLAVDLRGTGETAPGKPSQTGGDWKEFHLAYLLGRSLVGWRTEDVLGCARYLTRFESDLDRPVTLVATGDVGVPALHAVALEPQLFKTARIRRTIPSWLEVVRTPDSFNQFTTAVHGALRVYDLPDLVLLAGSDKVSVAEPASPAAK